MNLKEFASRIDLSVTTVSRALNGHPMVKPETRDFIVAEAARLSYTPSSAARRLATGKSGAFALFLELENNLMREALFREFLVGLFDELSRSQSDLIIKPTRAGDLADYLSFFQAGRVDGFVIPKPAVNDARIAYLQQHGIPFVVYGPAPIDVEYSYLTIDNGAAIRDLTSLLVDLGHRRIAFLNDDPAFAFARERADSFEATLRDRGLAFEPHLLTSTRMDERNGYQVVRALLERTDKPTAVICGNVLLAEGAYRAVQDIGLGVGKDISIVAHDDVDDDVPAERFRPTLTATEASLAKTGVKVADFLVRLSGGQASRDLQEVIPPRLIYRGSAAPPP